MNENHDERALAITREFNPTLARPLIHLIAEDPGQGLAMVKAMLDGLDTLRGWAIEQTQPEDWVLHGDHAVPNASACSIFRKAFGISVQPTGTPTVEPEDDGTWTASVVGTASCNVTGETDTFIGERNSAEEFGGRVPGGRNERESRKNASRKLTAVERSDLKKAALTNLKNTAARELAGIKRLPLPVLAERLGISADEVNARVQKGHGYGSRGDRDAQRGAESGVREQAEALFGECLAVMGQERAAASRLFREITSKGDFKGFDTPAKLRHEWQVKNATEKLHGMKVWKDYTAGNGGESGGKSSGRKRGGSSPRSSSTRPDSHQPPPPDDDDIPGGLL